MKAVLSRVAQQELTDAFRYYEHEQRGLGNRFLDDVEHARHLIAQLPHAWHPLSASLRRCVLRHFPYGLIYRLHNDRIEIIAVAHHHRQPEYWRDRIRENK
jgi:toxin ParE2